MFLEFLIIMLVSVAADFLASFFIMLIFSVVGIPFLAALSFWQIFGLLVVVGIAVRVSMLEFD